MQMKKDVTNMLKGYKDYHLLEVHAQADKQVGVKGPLRKRAGCQAVSFSQYEFGIWTLTFSFQNRRCYQRQVIS